jgi:hypothetical protein
MSMTGEGYRILKEAGAVARLDAAAMENGRILQHAYAKDWSAEVLASVARGNAERRTGNSEPKREAPPLLEQPARTLVAEVVRRGRSGRPPSFTASQVARAKLLKSRGAKLKEIGRHLGCSTTRAWDMVNDNVGRLARGSRRR